MGRLVDSSWFGSTIRPLVWWHIIHLKDEVFGRQKLTFVKRRTFLLPKTSLLSLHPPLASALGPWSISLLPLVGGGGRPGGSAFRILYSSLALLPLFFPARRVWHSRSRRFCPQPHSIHRSRSASKAPGSLGVAGGAPPPSSSGETSANQASCHVLGAS